MKPSRRQILRLAAGAAAMPELPLPARADTYPTRPIRLIVGGVPASAPDVIARLMAQWLSQRLGQPLVVENRSGASGNLATEAVVGAPADGYTLLLASASNAINTTLFDNLKFDFGRDTVPIAGFVTFPMVMTVNAAFPAKTLPDLIAAAKTNPGKINIGTPPVGSPQHVAGELFKMMSGANIFLIPYRGGPPAITDALSGHIQGVIGTVLLTIEQIRAGGLRPLAVTSTTRSELLPDVPPVNDFVSGFEAGQWIGLSAPKNTPADIIDRINRETNAGLADASMQERINNLGGTTIPGSAEAFGSFIKAETEKWAKVIKFADIKPQ
jgi:tripartite-type tricarboxylate transporter receptor subunit TctC